MEDILQPRVQFQIFLPNTQKEENKDWRKRIAKNNSTQILSYNSTGDQCEQKWSISEISEAPVWAERQEE